MKSDIFLINSSSEITFVDLNELIYLQADGRYTYFHFKDSKKITSSKNIGEYDKVLNDNFIRIHQSYIVNIHFIKSISTKQGFILHLKDSNVTLPIAKRRFKNLIDNFQL